MSCRIKFVAVGDISFGDSPLTFGFGVKSAFEKKRISFFNDDVIKILKSADICFGNLETVISDKNYNPGDLVSGQMRCGSDIVALLVDSGFNVLSVANNHMMQHGPDVFEETVSLLNSQNISPVGVADNSGQSIAYIYEVKGKEFCLLGYSMRPEKYNKPVLYSKGSREIILTDIERYKDSCDYLILSLHWGDEFVDFPSPVQVSDAHEFIDAGAKIILGHHPHIVQEVEKYNGGIIAYSLGNFIFDFWQKRLRESMILIVTLNDDDVEDVTIVPVRINKCYVPELLNGKEADNLTEKYQKLCNHPVLKQGAERSEFVGLYRKKYGQQVRWRLIENKIQNRLFFLSHFHKYPNGIAWQSLTGFVAGRMCKLNKNEKN